MKSARQKKILEIINKYEVETQDELIERLRESGFNVTQATVSRDIKEMKLVKIATFGNKYKYAQNTVEDSKPNAKFSNILRETVISVNYSNNIIVLRTYPGMANAAAAGIDAMHWNDVLGSLAGDDTIFIVIKSNDKAHELCERINQLIKSK